MMSAPRMANDIPDEIIDQIMQKPTSTAMLEVLQIIFPEKEGKWTKWADELKKEDIDTLSEFLAIKEPDFENLLKSDKAKITLLLGSRLRQLRTQYKEKEKIMASAPGPALTALRPSASPSSDIKAPGAVNPHALITQLLSDLPEHIQIETLRQKIEEGVTAVGGLPSGFTTLVLRSCIDFDDQQSVEKKNVTYFLQSPSWSYKGFTLSQVFNAIREQLMSPSGEVYPWFYGNITGDAATDKLTDGKAQAGNALCKGTFLVRVSKKDLHNCTYDVIKQDGKKTSIVMRWINDGMYGLPNTAYDLVTKSKGWSFMLQLPPGRGSSPTTHPPGDEMKVDNEIESYLRQRFVKYLASDEFLIISDINRAPRTAQYTSGFAKGVYYVFPIKDRKLYNEFKEGKLTNIAIPLTVALTSKCRNMSELVKQLNIMRVVDADPLVCPRGNKLLEEMESGASKVIPTEDQGTPHGAQPSASSELSSYISSTPTGAPHPLITHPLITSSPLSSSIGLGIGKPPG